MPGFLSGFSVIELCTWYTGPMAACILGDYGADIIKVEPPGGDPFRVSGTSRAGYGAMFMAANRNKRSIVLDLKTEADKDVLLRLISRADVLIQNSRAGSMQRLGLDPDSLCARFPRLIYASISGYGPSGPLSADGAFDPLIQALCGLADIQGGSSTPALIKTLLADKTVPLVAAQAITSALLQRERRGRGCKLDIAMLDAMIWWTWPDGMMNQTFLGGGERQAADIATANSICPTDDGFLVVCPHQDQAWDAFTRVVGRPDLKTDQRFLTAQARMEHLQDYFAAIRGCFKGKTTTEWCAVLRAQDVPCAPVVTREDIADHPQVVWNELLQQVDHPQAGRLISVRPPVRVEGKLSDIQSLAPAVGQHSAEILGELGLALP